MFSIINIDEKEKWNEIVKSFANYDVYYLSDYVKAFQLHGDGEPTLIYYNDNSFKAMNVVMKKDIGKDEFFSNIIPENTLFDMTTPYGYGGFILEGDITENKFNKFIDEYISLCNDQRIISEFVRFHPVLNNVKKLDNFYDVLNIGSTITLDLESKTKIWENFTSKNRNVVRKAKKSGVRIYWGRSISLFEHFISLYNKTMDKNKANDYYYFEKDFYNSILEDLKYNSLIFYAVYDEKIIAMSIILFGNQQLHYHLSASDRDYSHLGPTNLLLYEVACWGCENNFKTFHLGGGVGSKEDSLFKFKKAFNKDSHTYYSIGKKIINEEIYDKLVKIRQENEVYIINESFFPLYRG